LGTGKKIKNKETEGLEENELEEGDWILKEIHTDYKHCLNAHATPLAGTE
jgi:hypothetical protein